MYRQPASAPESSLAPERRGRVVGRFCRVCRGIYPRYASHHVGKPSYGRDHVASPCSEEGQPFEAEASWWEPAVEVLPARPAAVAAS